MLLTFLREKKTSKTKGEIGLKSGGGDEVFFFKTCLPRTLIHFLSGYYSGF